MNNKEDGSRPEKDTALKEEAKKKLISVSCQLHTQGRPDIEQHLPLRPKRTPTSNLKVPKCAAGKMNEIFILEKPKREGEGEAKQIRSKRGQHQRPPSGDTIRSFPPPHARTQKSVEWMCFDAASPPPLLLLSFYFVF